MIFRILACFLAILLASTGWAQVIVDENFNSYANAAALSQVWVPMIGDGTLPTAGPIAILTPCVSGDPCPPLAPYNGLGDPSVVPPVAPLSNPAAVFSNLGSNVNEWDNDNNHTTAPFHLLPSATQNVRYSADIFDDGGEYPQSASGRRFSVGLRNDTIDREPGTFGMQAGLNMIELGMWQAPVIDPTGGGAELPITFLAYRVVLFSNPQAPLIQNPDWQYFPLPPEFDDPTFDHNGDGRFGNGDGISSNRDVGPGWHRYAAEVSTEGIRLTLDLFRDGVIDSEVFVGISMAADPLDPTNIAGFTSLRMGGPSGVTMNEFTMVDNVRLEMVDRGTTITGDFNNDGLYDCVDINMLAGDILGPGTPATFDLTGDGVVDLADRDAWLSEAGNHNLGPGRAYLLGDANLDGGVDGSDFGVWNAAKFTSPNPAAYCAGDFNIDGGVDGSDFGIWNANKFQSADSGMVPEPTTGIFALFFGIAAFTLRRQAR